MLKELEKMEEMEDIEEGEWAHFKDLGDETLILTFNRRDKSEVTQGDLSSSSSMVEEEITKGERCTPLVEKVGEHVILDHWPMR